MKFSKITLIVFSLLFLSCGNNKAKVIQKINGGALELPKVQKQYFYFKNQTECSEPLNDSLPQKSHLKIFHTVPQYTNSKSLNLITVKELIENGYNIRIPYVYKSKNYNNVKSYFNVPEFDFLCDSTLCGQNVNYCNFNRVFLDKNNNIYFTITYSSNMEHPRLILYPFIFSEFVYCYAHCGSAFYDDEWEKKIITDGKMSIDDNLIFIDKVNKLRLCFGIESSQNGYREHNPIWWPRLYILDENFYPIFYLRFRFDDVGKGKIDIENIFKMVYYKGTKYVKKYQEIDFSSLKSTIWYSDTTKYKTIVNFVKLLLNKGFDLPNKVKDAYEDYPIHYDTHFFPPVPEWGH